jgi:hypothetical protein
MKTPLSLFVAVVLSVLPAMADGPVPIRLAADQYVRQAIPIDINTQQSPVFVRGDDLEFDVAILTNGGVMPNWTNIATITLSIYQEQNDTDPPLMTSTLTNNNPAHTNWAAPWTNAINTNLSQGAWTNNTGLGPRGYPTNFAARFIFPSAQTAISLNGQASAGYWIRIYVTTAYTPPAVITCLQGPITVLDGPIANVAAPVPGQVRFWTINGATVIQIRDDTSGLYRTLGVEDDPGTGTPMFYLSDQGY